MVLKCKCGNFKNAMPWRLATVMPWVCDRCANAEDDEDIKDDTAKTNGNKK